MKATRESAVLRACLDLLTLRKVFHWRSNQGAIPTGKGGFRRFVGLKGVSDILGILPGGQGRLLAVECKKPGGRLRNEQRMFLATVNDLGGLGVVIDDVAELDRILNEVIP